MKAKTVYLLAVLVLGIAFWWSAAALWGVRSDGSLFVWLIAAGLLVAALAWAAANLAVWVWVAAGLVTLGALCLPASTVVQMFGLPWLARLGSFIDLALLLVIAMALVLVALLLNSGLGLVRARCDAPVQEGKKLNPRHLNRTVLFVFVLGALLLAKALHSLYWFLVWDTTGDSLGILWLVVPVPAVLYAGIVLSIALPGRQKLAGLAYLLLIPALIAVPTLAARVDFRRLTDERAGQVSQAIEAYHARQGHYPQSLRQLTLRYALTLPGPVVLYGQGWCYDAGEDYFRLGYIDREHWSDPNLIGHTYKAEGRLPELDPICAQEIAALQAR